MPPKPNEQQQNSPESLEGLNKVFGDMSKKLDDLPSQIAKSVNQGLQSFAEQQQAMQQRQQRSQKQTKQTDNSGSDDKPKEVSEADLEKMSRAQFGNYIMKQIGSMIDEKLQPVQESLSTNVEETQRERVREAYQKAREAHPDFDKWKDEMSAIIEKQGYMDPEDLYLLARSKNPEKAKEVDEELEASSKGNGEDKTKDEKANQDESDTTQKGGFPFHGLMPTSGTAGEGGDETDFKTTKDAAEAAFDEIMKGVDASVVGEAE